MLTIATRIEDFHFLRYNSKKGKIPACAEGQAAHQKGPEGAFSSRLPWHGPRGPRRHTRLWELPNAENSKSRNGDPPHATIPHAQHIKDTPSKTWTLYSSF